MEKVILSWSSGKDSAFALYELQRNPAYEVVGLLTTITREYDRVSMHGVRTSLVEQQAEAAGLPLNKVFIPANCTDEIYSAIMSEEMNKLKGAGVNTVAFGDIFLQDVRNYREKNLSRVKMKCLFPLWGKPSMQLARDFIGKGFKSVVVSIDTRMVESQFLGRVIDRKFLDELPVNVDPCAENGEFHSFAFDGPVFAHKILCTIGEKVTRAPFQFIELLPDEVTK